MIYDILFIIYRILYMYGAEPYWTELGFAELGQTLLDPQQVAMDS